jgi:hypothetical protein
MNPDDKDSASTKWLRHYVINDCPICWVGESAEESQFCAKGKELREAAYLAGDFTVPRPPKKPHHSAFNPAMERHG